MTHRFRGGLRRSGCSSFCRRRVGLRGRRVRAGRPPPASRRESPASPELARLVSTLAMEKQAEEVVVIDLRGISPEADFFVIMSALSEPHQRALTDHILEGLEARGVRHWHMEGYRSSGWVLLDYVDVVVHIFRPDARAFYSLEDLWGDAPRERLGDVSREKEDPR